MLKGQCHEMFDLFGKKKNYTWAPYEQGNTTLKFFLEDIPEKRGVSVVVD